MNKHAIRNYCSLHFFDWLFCTMITAGLTVNVLAGFELTGDLWHNIPIFLGIGAVLQLICYAAMFSRKSTWISGAVFALAVIGLIVYARSKGTFSDDAAQTNRIIVIVVIMTALITALLSVTRGGIVALILIGTYINAGAAFVEFPVKIPAFVLFLAGSILLLLYRVYRITIVHAAKGNAQYGRYVLQLASLCLAGLVLAAGVFVLIIKPLDPPTDELKLIQKLEQSQIIQRSGIATVYTFPDFNLRSQMQTDNSRTTENTDQQKDQDSESQNSETQDDQLQEGTVQDQLQNAYAIRYVLEHNLWWLIVIIIALVIAAPFVIREQLRKRWYGKLCAMGTEAQAFNLYNYYLYLFRKLKLRRLPDVTLEEYADRFRRDIEPYDVTEGTEGTASFRYLTELYTQMAYGQHRLTAEELAAFHTYYKDIRKRVRSEIGIPRFALLYFFV